MIRTHSGDLQRPGGETLRAFFGLRVRPRGRTEFSRIVGSGKTVSVKLRRGHRNRSKTRVAEIQFNFRMANQKDVAGRATRFMPGGPAVVVCDAQQKPQVLRTKPATGPLLENGPWFLGPTRPLANEVLTVLVV